SSCATSPALYLETSTGAGCDELIAHLIGFFPRLALKRIDNSLQFPLYPWADVEKTEAQAGSGDSLIFPVNNFAFRDGEKLGVKAEPTPFPHVQYQLSKAHSRRQPSGCCPLQQCAHSAQRQIKKTKMEDAVIWHLCRAVIDRV